MPLKTKRISASLTCTKCSVSVCVPVDGDIPDEYDRWLRVETEFLSPDTYLSLTYCPACAVGIIEGLGYKNIKEYLDVVKAIVTSSKPRHVHDPLVQAELLALRLEPTTDPKLLS